MKAARTAALAVGVVTFVGGAGAGLAQYPGGGSSPGARAGKAGGQPPSGEGRNPSQMAAASAAEQALGQLQELEANLKLAAAQRFAWSAYARKVQQLADDRLARIPIPLIAPAQAIQGGGARGMPPGDPSLGPRSK